MSKEKSLGRRMTEWGCSTALITSLVGAGLTVKFLSIIECSTLKDIPSVMNLCKKIRNAATGVVEEPEALIEKGVDAVNEVADQAEAEIEAVLQRWAQKVAEITASLPKIPKSETSILPHWITVYGQPGLQESEIISYGKDVTPSNLLRPADGLNATAQPFELLVLAQGGDKIFEIAPGYTTGRIILRVQGPAGVDVRSFCSAYSHVGVGDGVTETITDTFFNPSMRVDDSYAEYNLQPGQAFAIDGGCYPNPLLISVPDGTGLIIEFVPLQSTSELQLPGAETELLMSTVVRMVGDAVHFDLDPKIVQQHKPKFQNTRHFHDFGKTA